jgi:hypothetical protein
MLLTAVLTEILYIVFRNPSYNNFNKYIYFAVCGLSAVSFFNNPGTYEIVRASSGMALFLSQVLLRHKPYEKPDYRYLIILTGTVLIYL